MPQQFVLRSQSVPLYQGSSSGNEQVWYLLPQNAIAFRGPLSVSQCWQQPGCFIFLQQSPPPASLTAFAQAVWARINQPPAVGRFAWFSNPQQSGVPLQGQVIFMAQSGSATLRQTPFPYGTLNLEFDSGCSLGIQGESVSIGNGSSTTILLSLANGTKLTIISGSVTLPLSGAFAGQLLFPALLTGSATENDFKTLDVGLRLYSEDVSDLSSWRYPVFNEHQQVAVYGCWDPLQYRLLPNLLRLQRRRRRADIPDWGLPQHHVLCFAVRQCLLPAAPGRRSCADGLRPPGICAESEHHPPQGSDPYYLTPLGDFAIQVNGGSNFMCGLSGQEAIALPGAGNSVLSFFDGQPAYVQEPYGPASLVFADGVAQPSTSWAYVSLQGQQLTYLVQPESSPYYQAGTSDPALPYLLLPANGISAPPSPDVAFPMMPYANLDPAPSNPPPKWRRRFSRRFGGAHCAARPNSGVAHNSGGHNEWNSNRCYTARTPLSVLDRSAAMAKPHARVSRRRYVEFANIDGNLRDALQTNDLFLVITDPDSISGNFTSAQIAIDGWAFDASPSTWTQHGTIMVFKFSRKSLNELASNPAAWTQGPAFNADVTQASANLVQALGNISDPIILDQNWQGILLLNVSTPINQLPAGLGGLTAGMNADRFFAQYLAIEASSVSSDGTQVENSSLSGSINYGPFSLVPSSAPYQFKVKSLNVVFANSAIASFESEVSSPPTFCLEIRGSGGIERRGFSGGAPNRSERQRNVRVHPPNAGHHRDEEQHSERDRVHESAVRNALDGFQGEHRYQVHVLGRHGLRRAARPGRVLFRQGGFGRSGNRSKLFQRRRYDEFQPK